MRADEGVGREVDAGATTYDVPGTEFPTRQTPDVSVWMGTKREEERRMGNATTKEKKKAGTAAGRWIRTKTREKHTNEDGTGRSKR